MHPLPRRHLLSAAIAAAFGPLLNLAAVPSAQAQAAGDANTQAFEVRVPAQPLAAALNELSRQTGVQVFAAGDAVAGVQSQPVSGRMTIDQAMRAVLAGSPLGHTRAAGGAVTVLPAGAAGTSGGSLPSVPVRAAAERETATGPVDGYLAKRSATGTKTDTPLIETPQSVSVVTADRINALGATRVKEALGYTPGVNIAPYGTDSRYDWVFVRGFNAYAPGYYLDGLQTRNANTYGTWQNESYGAERVEILRGPASVLYGQNSAGGMINVVSKRPTAEPRRELQAQLGSNSRKQVAGDFSGPIDDEGKWLYRVTGLVRDGELEMGGLPDDRVFIAPALTWKPSGDTSLTLLSQYLRIRSASTYQSPPLLGTLYPNPNGRIPTSTYFGEPGFDHYDQDQWMLGYQFEHRFNPTFAVRQNLRYGDFDQDYLNVVSNGLLLAVNPANPSDPANFRSSRRRVFGSREKAHSLTVDNHLQADLRHGDWQHRLLVGLDHQRTRFDYRSFNGGAVAPLDMFSPTYGGAVVPPPSPFMSGDVKLNQTGLYLQDQLKFGDRWAATVGGRYDSASIDSLDRLSNRALSETQRDFTGRAGLIYLHPSGWAPYVSYAESFSPITTTNPATGRLFEPETGHQVEAGLRYQRPGGNDSYSAAIFDLTRRNYLTYDPAFAQKQTGEIKVRGLEFEATLRPVAALNLTASYAYTPKADVTASSTPSEVGRQANPVPRHQASLWGDYRLPIGLKLGLGVRYVGSTYGYNETVLGNGVPSFTLVDALVGYDIGRWNLALNVRNLTDKEYLASAYNITPTQGVGYFGERRRVMATATYRW